MPYLMYDAINDSRVRPSHLALDGVIRPVGDPFWKTHTPPLGHRCRCTLRALDRNEARERGGPTQNVPAEGVADPGWGSDPRAWGSTLGRLARERMASCDIAFAQKRMGVQMHCTPDGMVTLFRALAAEYQATPLPPPKTVSRDMLIDPAAFGQAELYRRFLDSYDADNVRRWTEKIGIEIGPDKSLFLAQDGGWKITKNRRAGYMLLFADTLADPATVQWIQDQNGPDRLGIFGEYRIGGNRYRTAIYYKLDGSAWIGWSAFTPLEKQWPGYVLAGVPIWRRNEKPQRA